MTISSLSPIGTPQTNNIASASDRLQAVIASLVSGTQNAQTSDNIAAPSIAAQLQSQTAALRQASNNLAQGLSLSQVADGGAEQIQSALDQLQSLAAQAGSPTVNADTRKQLNQQFQQIVNEVDQLASGTSFDGKPLLDGSLSGNGALSIDSLLSGNNSGGGSDLSIADLSSNSLFGGVSLDILTSDSAQQAVAVVADALNQVTGARASIGSFQQTLDFASATVNSAIANQDAARSELQDTDFAAASTQASLADVQRNASIALAAQANRLSPALLQLIG